MRSATQPEAPASFLILGAYGGVGSELARKLASAGARLLLSGRDEAQLAALAASLHGAGQIETFAADATDSAQVEAAMQHAMTSFGALDGAVNCVGSLLLKPAHLTSEEEFQQTIATNLFSAFALVRAAGKHMATPQNGGGSVVLLSTAAARTGLSNHEAIAAAKGGIEGLMLSAAATYAPRKLRVNCVAPGLTETPLTAKITGNETVAKGSRSMHALDRFGTPADIASAIAFLLNPANNWITGQVLGVDGGLGSVRARVS